MSHFKYLAYVEYGTNNTPARDATPKITVNTPTFPGTTNCAAAAMAPMSAPKLKTFGTDTTISTQ